MVIAIGSGWLVLAPACWPGTSPRLPGRWTPMTSWWATSIASGSGSEAADRSSRQPRRRLPMHRWRSSRLPQVRRLDRLLLGIEFSRGVGPVWVERNGPPPAGAVVCRVSSQSG